MNKKIIFFVVTLLSMLAFTACGKKSLFTNGKINAEDIADVEEIDLPLQDTDSDTEVLDDEEKPDDDSPSELEEFFSNPVNMVMLENEVAMGKKEQQVFSKTNVKVSGNRIIMEFYCKEHYGDIQKLVEYGMVTVKNELIDHIRSYCETKEPIEVEFIYYNPDDSVAADYVMSEDEEDGIDQYETTAKEGTIQYFYETSFGADYWSTVSDILMQTQNDQFSDIKIECVNNTLIYTFFCREQIGDVQKEFEQYMSEDFRNMLIKDIKDTSGIKDKIKIVYIIVNPDGKPACELEFEG